MPCCTLCFLVTCAMGNLCLAKSVGPSSDWAELSWEPCNVSAWEGGGAEVSAGKGGGICALNVQGWPASPCLLCCQLQNVYTRWSTSPWRMAESSVSFPTGKHLYTRVFAWFPCFPHPFGVSETQVQNPWFKSN